MTHSTPPAPGRHRRDRDEWGTPPPPPPRAKRKIGRTILRVIFALLALVVLLVVVAVACAPSATPPPPPPVSSPAGGTLAPVPADPNAGSGVDEDGTAPTGDQSNVGATQPEVIKVKTLGDAFEANKLAAEQEWGGRFVQFTAKVGNINELGVTFTDVTTKYSFTQISCALTDESQALKLTKDKPATVRGVIGEDQFLGVISLTNCEVVK